MRPTDSVLIIKGDNREAALAPWGFPAPWDGKPLINARLETLTEKPTFKAHLHRRCLVPATSYFEWQKQGGHKIKCRIEQDLSPIMTFAGLFDEAGKVTIITTSPTPDVEAIHHRMPLVLGTDEAATIWLDDPQAIFRDGRQPDHVLPRLTVERLDQPPPQLSLFS